MCFRAAIPVGVGNADEGVQVRAGQHRGHLLGVFDEEWQEIQPLGANGLDPDGVHAAPPS
jgi:hypothetical protein